MPRLLDIGLGQEHERSFGDQIVKDTVKVPFLVEPAKLFGERPRVGAGGR